jgi:hypothetical protein
MQSKDNHLGEPSRQLLILGSMPRPCSKDTMGACSTKNTRKSFDQMGLPQQQKMVAEPAFQHAAIARICTAMTLFTPVSTGRARPSLKDPGCAAESTIELMAMKCIITGCETEFALVQLRGNVE